MSCLYTPTYMRMSGVISMRSSTRRSSTRRQIINTIFTHYRRLHFQKPPYEQAKLVRVLKGTVIDFAVDIRKDSKTFGEWRSALLTGENRIQFFIPRGFAHGFIVLSDEAVFEYKCDNYYSKENEDGIRWDDKNISVSPLKLFPLKDYISRIMEENNIESLILSEKDKNRITTLKDLC